ncbi:hypothetical protein [Deinococcus humi]|uniref:Uncharacterized protein n=1 Tax=Deinococcus humi TaxID=662880 RepID=A0A7W8NF16_9DEIO|nr:hypothetical protein [Deinococcus humi]MBB5363946.1 hypothetical protein [Deinococcus humi]GGO32873.1 hypothetical protein GCM10008949_31190 [Deinococcus humi]
MIRFQKITLLWLGLPLLAGCGSVVGAFVPPQTINNLANMNGAVLTSSSALKIQTVVGTVQYDTSASLPPKSFPDFEYPSDVPFGMRPHAASVKVSFTDATVSGPCLAPDTFNLTIDAFSIALWDSSAKASAVTMKSSPKLTVHATKTQTGITGTSYQLTSNIVVANADQATTDKAINILTTGGPNDTSASAQISADNDALAGCRLSFTLGNASVTLSDFH